MWIAVCCFVQCSGYIMFMAPEPHQIPLCACIQGQKDHSYVCLRQIQKYTAKTGSAVRKERVGDEKGKEEEMGVDRHRE